MKRIDLSIPELKWIHAALRDKMRAILNSGTGELPPLEQLYYDNLNDLLVKIERKLEK